MTRPSTLGTDWPATFHSAAGMVGVSSPMVSTSFRPLVSSPKPSDFAGRGDASTLPPARLERAAVDAPAPWRPGRAGVPRAAAAARRSWGTMRRRGPAAEGPHVEGNVIGVAHDQLHRFDRQLQLVGHGHGQRGPGVLADLRPCRCRPSPCRPRRCAARRRSRAGACPPPPRRGRRPAAPACPAPAPRSSRPRQSTSRPPPRMRRKSRRAEVEVPARFPELVALGLDAPAPASQRDREGSSAHLPSSGWRPGGSRPRCGDRSRTGRCCRAWPRRSPRRWDRGSRRAARPRP